MNATGKSTCQLNNCTLEGGDFNLLQERYHVWIHSPNGHHHRINCAIATVILQDSRGFAPFEQGRQRGVQFPSLRGLWCLVPKLPWVCGAALGLLFWQRRGGSWGFLLGFPTILALTPQVRDSAWEACQLRGIPALRTSPRAGDLNTKRVPYSSGLPVRESQAKNDHCLTSLSAPQDLTLAFKKKLF